MIMPTIRASLSRSDARQLAALIGRDDPDMSEAARRRLDEHGVDSLLDDPRVLNGLLTDPDVSVPLPPSSSTCWCARHCWRAVSTTGAPPITWRP